MSSQPPGPPIFVLGMMQRTGTNHFWDLMGLHPDTKLLKPIFEDQLVRWTPHLFDYVDDVTKHWSEDWDVPPSERESLLTSLGDGVVRWLACHSADRRVVTKMPDVAQVDRFFKIFPDCPLVILVRDGRSTCESIVKSFGWSYERAFRRWSNAAGEVVRFRDEHVNDPRFLIVRYEELIERPSQVMREVCRSTGLDPDRFPYERVDSLPVRGSSTLRTDTDGEVSWVPIERSESFNPRERWHGWDTHTHRRFAVVAGVQQSALGYELVETEGRDTIAERLADWRYLVADARYRELRVKALRIRRAVIRSSEVT